MVATSLIDKHVGLEELGDGIWRIYSRQFPRCSGIIWDWDVIFLVRKILVSRGPRNLFYVARF